MATVIVGRNESLDSALKRFKRKVETQGIIKNIKSHKEYLKPSVKRKQKHEEAEKLRRRKVVRTRKSAANKK